MSFAPISITYRELWLPGHIRGTQLASSVPGGHPITLTGAQKKTTSDGFHGDGSATSYINLGAIHNAAAKLTVSIDFTPDINYGAGVGGNGFIVCKQITVADGLRIFIEGAGSGQLRVVKRDGGADTFVLSSVETSWVAGTRYNIVFSISSVNAARLRVNNGAAVTNADTSALVNGGNFVIGSEAVGAINGFKGKIHSVCVRADDVTTAQETLVYKGVPFASANNFYMLDEGRGLTAYDRGSGANNGTLGQETWAWGQVKVPTLSLDKLNDYGVSSQGVNIRPPCTLYMVLKNKFNWNQNDAADTETPLALSDVAAANYIRFVQYFGSMRASTRGQSGAEQQITYATGGKDDYIIAMLTVTAAGVMVFYFNGNSVGTATLATQILSIPSIAAFVGIHSDGASYRSVANFIEFGLIDGVLSTANAKTYSRWLRDRYNLPIII